MSCSLSAPLAPGILFSLYPEPETHTQALIYYLFCSLDHTTSMQVIVEYEEVVHLKGCKQCVLRYGPEPTHTQFVLEITKTQHLQVIHDMVF